MNRKHRPDPADSPAVAAAKAALAAAKAAQPTVGQIIAYGYEGAHLAKQTELLATIAARLPVAPAPAVASHLTAEQAAHVAKVLARVAERAAIAEARDLHPAGSVLFPVAETA